MAGSVQIFLGRKESTELAIMIVGNRMVLDPIDPVSRHPLGSEEEQAKSVPLRPKAAGPIQGYSVPRDALLRVARIAISVVCLTMAGLGVSRFPVNPEILAGVLAAYGVLLWYRPAAFLLVLPVVLPAFDLGIWSGWIMVAESDFFVLTTLAVLIVRVPPGLADLLPTGLPRMVLLCFAASWGISTVIGLTSPLGAPYSDNAFLRPDNALRLAKGFVEAVVLLPFLRQRERSYSDAVSLLGYGMAMGIAAVTILVSVERALFVPFLDITATYRVVGPFSSMRIGGGHIGAYICLALPMALCLPRLRPRWMGMILLGLTCILGTYSLAMSFARTAYVAGAIAMGIAGIGWLWASIRQHRPVVPGLIAVVLIIVVVAGMGSSGGMRGRLVVSASDFAGHRANWGAGLAVRDTDVRSDLFGMGLGTYQRAMLMRSPVDRPTDIVLVRDEQGAYVSISLETAFYFGQKITVPAAGNLHLTLRVRGKPYRGRDDPSLLDVSICDKILLYSDQCRGGSTSLRVSDIWQPISMMVPVAGLAGQSPMGWLRRPVELSVSGQIGRRIEIRDIRLTDDAGHPLIANGDFARGLDFWGFTDDTHTAWRMFNQYLMLWFETGGLGVVAFVAFAGLALAGGARAAWNGAATGAAVSGSVAGFLISGLFDNVLEAPRLATLFFLIGLCGLVQWEDRRQRPRLIAARPKSR